MTREAIAHSEHLRQLARDHHHSSAGGRDLVHELVDLDLGPDVYTARGLVENEDPGAG